MPRTDLWTKEEENRVNQLKAEGRTARNIAGILASEGKPRSIDAIKKRWRVEGTSRKLKKIIAKSDPRPRSSIVSFVKGVFNINGTFDKVLAIYDSHFPYHIDHGPMLDWAGREFKPNYILMGGDNFDMGVVSRHDEELFNNIGYDNIALNLKKQAGRFGAYLDEIKRASPFSQMVYLEGNHENWLEQYKVGHPQLEAITLESLFDLKAREINLITRGKYWKLGKIYFCHGDQWGSMNPSKQAVERGMRNIVMGHWHAFKTWSHYGQVDSSDKFVAWCVPCMCSLSPGYLRGRTTPWVNGFFYATVKKKSGNFSANVQLTSNKGHFISHLGREYT